jgi:uncharacterized protein YegP (UPF0339 family)
MAHTFEIHKDKSGQFRVRFKYSGEVIFSTEAYTTKASAQKAIRSIKENGPASPVNDLTLAAKAPKVAEKAPAKLPAKSSKPAASAAAKPVAAAKAAAKAVGAAVKSAVKTSSKK